MQRRVSEGQALIIIALALPVLVGIAGLALDAGHLYYERRTLQSIADAAAITGAQRPNYNVTSPGITAGGVADAEANALLNGAQAGEVAVFVPPQTVPGEHYNGKPGYIEVVVTRQVDHWFMPLFGMTSTEVKARAVARSYIPGYGSAAIIALGNDDYYLNPAQAGNEITFNGQAGVVGDVISYGAIIANGNATNFPVDGSTYAYGGNSADVDATGENYGLDNGLDANVPANDPMAQGEAAGTHTFPAWPTNNGPWEAKDASCTLDDDADPLTSCPTRSGSGGNVTIKSNEEATFEPGKYGDIKISGQATFEPGVYIVKSLTLSGNADVIGDGVLFQVIGTGTSVDFAGTTRFRFTAHTPYDPTTPISPITGQPYVCSHPAPPDYAGPPCNTWMNIVFYLSANSTSQPAQADINGNGVDRVINGGVYAPYGHVRVTGNGAESVINGQVIANTVNLSGEGPTVNYPFNVQEVTFAPILVNTPRVQ